MGESPYPEDEIARLGELTRYEILDSPPEDVFDRITRLASSLVGTPISLISLVDANRQYLKSRHGLDVAETPRDVAFCAHAIMGNEIMVVEDATKDRRFSDNPLVTGEPHIAFYAGIPLRSSRGYNLGTLCVIDRIPRQLPPGHRAILHDLAAIAVDEMELRLAGKQALREIAARAALEARLRTTLALARNTIEERSAFVAKLSHEIRNPMNGILGMADLLMEEEIRPQQRHHLMTMRIAAEYTMGILNNTLDYSKIEHGGLVFEEIPFDPRELVTVTLDILRPTIRHKKLLLDAVIAPEIPAVLLGDPARIRQILLNLVGNGIKFTEAGYVAIRLAKKETAGGVSSEACHLVFTVEDTGIGVSAADRSKLFKEFVQADPSISRRFGGTGLGLAISHQLASMMGGTFSVDSEPGRGTAFSFDLILKIPADCAPKISAAPAADSVPPAPPRLSILLAEDDKLGQIVVTNMIRRQGHQVELVGTGNAAVAAVKRRDYDLVLMDINMPELDGLAATSEIRQLDGPGRNIPIIGLTGDSSGDTETICRLAGMTDYTAKPITAGRLKALLAQFAGTGRQHG